MIKPKVSIIIPVHNVERYLGYCLESVIVQTLNEIEIICVEDASTDHSRKILEKYAAKDSRIRIIWHERNAGAHKSRKDAVLSARGKYIMFLDGDDELFPNACELAYKVIEKDRTDAVRFGVQHIDYQGNFVTTSSFRLTKRLKRIEDDNWLFMFEKGQIKGWSIWDKIYNAALCKMAFEQMEDGYMVMAEDVYYFFVFGYFATSFSMIEDVLYKYRQGAGIWSGNQKQISLEKYKILLSERRALDAINRFYATRLDTKKFEPIIQKRVRDHFYRQSVLWLLNSVQKSDQIGALQAFTETWGNIDVAYMLKCFSEIKEQYVKYTMLRIDIRNRGSERNNVIEQSVIPKPAFLKRPAWLANGITIESDAGSMTVVLQCQGDGEFEVALMGQDIRNAVGKRFPVWIDCTYFAVNGETIFSDVKTVCHDKRYIYKKAVKNREEIRLEMAWSECQSSNVLDEYKRLQSDLKNKNNEVIQLEWEKARAKQELYNVKNGWSYRFARLITWFPRKVRDYLKK